MLKDFKKEKEIPM